MFPRNPVVIVDDEQFILINLKGILKSHGIGNVLTCQDSAGVMELLAETDVEVLLLDLAMPGVSGHELLPQIREEYPDIPVIIITGTAEVSTAVECMKLGVFDYLVKAIEESKLVGAVTRAIERRELERENASLRNHLVGQSFENPEAVANLVCEDSRMRSIILYCESIASSSQTVLLTGETGVGKDALAEAIHVLSERSGEMVKVNVAGLDDNMFSDTLFGHTKEAYTGADHARKGLVATAGNGTLFLDEIGDLSPKSQVNLLRFLETKEYYPLGSDTPHRSNARVIVATNKELQEAVLTGVFRKDLYYRLRTHRISIAPLRERPGDLPAFIDRFVHEAKNEYGKSVEGISPEVYDVLRGYGFPGNIRELRSMIFEAVSQHDSGALSAHHIRNLVGENAIPTIESQDGQTVKICGRFPTLKQVNEFLIAEAMKRSGGNQAEAARLLGISGPALSRRLKTRRAEKTSTP